MTREGRCRSGFAGFRGFGFCRFVFVRSDFAGFEIGVALLGETAGVARFFEHRRHHVDALLLHLGLFGRTSDVDLDGHGHFGVQRNANVEQADGLDRLVENDLRTRDLVTFAFKCFDDVADRDRAVQLASARCLTDQNDLRAVDLLGFLFGFATLLSVFLFEPLTIGFEDLLVGFVGAQRLAVGEQEVARVTVLDGNDVADGAQLLDTFEEDDGEDWEAGKVESIDEVEEGEPSMPLE